MKVLVNVFHPNMKSSIANKAWLQALQKESTLTVREMYQEYPDWNIDVTKEQSLLLSHDRIVFQHPFYWYSCPPLMKKWLDDVLTLGWAYGPGGTQLTGKEWLSAITTGGPQFAYQAGSYNHFSMSELLKPFQQTANLTKMVFLPAFLLQGTPKLTSDEILKSAMDYVRYVMSPETNPARRT